MWPLPGPKITFDKSFVGVSRLLVEMEANWMRKTVRIGAFEPLDGVTIILIKAARLVQSASM